MCSFDIRHVVFIMDQGPSDTMTYYTFREFSQTVVDHLHDQNLITYITFDPSAPEHDTLNLIVNSRSVGNFTADIWHQRAEPKHRRYKLDFMKKATRKISIVLLVSNLLQVRKSLSSDFDCEEYTGDVEKCVIVHEIFINNHRAAKERDVYPPCMYNIQSDFKSLADFH